jgi:hypothetical protein
MELSSHFQVPVTLLKGKSVVHWTAGWLGLDFDISHFVYIALHALTDELATLYRTNVIWASKIKKG